MPRSKRPRFRAEPSIEKRPRVAQEPRNEDDARISWRLGDADMNERWAWNAIDPARVAAVVAFLAEMDKLTWPEASRGHRGRCKMIPTTEICEEAQRRLVAIGHDDEDSLAEFHLTGMERIWGIRRGSICHILWWDPDHSVCPSTLRRT